MSARRGKRFPAHAAQHRTQVARAPHATAAAAAPPGLPVECALRLACREDLAAIVAIYNSIVAGRQVTADLEPVTVASRLAWFEAQLPPRRPLWVLQRDGQVIGWMAYRDFHPRSAYDATAEIALYLAESARGQGLGQALLAEGLQRAPGCGIRTVMALIFAHNTPSTRLFEQAGFARWGNYPRIALLDGFERDLWVYGKRV